MQLNRLHSQRIADELFIFGVNAGVLNATRLAQKLLGIKCDGIVGEATIKALNSYDEAECLTTFYKIFRSINVKKQ
ncbi:hypothetical protein KDE12_01995 [Campylobacter sp. faydin G-105]|uniref:putative peptidoglycan-binding domain-containing protein n=1 Tax=Campylobacter anatolicus TaxID=2829105 RepID=UPI001B9FA55A|nr:putative peptidoglycan-binding domain-containing protein [Campylobacter anatolicus]MBR8461621.1 hypothetical protein [Campylobacter anatolicus]